VGYLEESQEWGRVATILLGVFFGIPLGLVTLHCLGNKEYGILTTAWRVAKERKYASRVEPNGESHYGDTGMGA